MKKILKLTIMLFAVMLSTGLMAHMANTSTTVIKPASSPMPLVGCTNPYNGGTIAAPQTNCGGFDPAEIISTGSPLGWSANGGEKEYKWMKSTTNATTGFTDIPNTNSSTYDPPSISVTTWYKRGARVTCNGNTYQPAGESNVVEMTVLNCTAVWDGSTSPDWNTGANWDGGVVPTSGYNITIANVANQPVIASGNNGDCNDLTINSGATLTIKSLGFYSGSLITNGTVTNNGTINIERTIADDKWHLISAPISNATANTFNGQYLQNYNGTWNDITEPTTALNVAQGYSLWSVPSGKGGGSSTLFTFTGDINTGSQSIAITDANDGWNLLGNPYPSSIDWAGLDDTYGAVYYWNSTSYVTWNNGVGTGSQYIPVMQGFWIKTASAGTFSLGNINRVHHQSTPYYKNRELPQNYIDLQVTGNGYSDNSIVILNEQATDNFDFYYDAYKLLSPMDSVPQIYSISGGDILSLDNRPQSEVIQLGFMCGVSGNYSINLNKLTDISSVILEDTKTGTMHDMQDGNYNFEYSITDNETRFRLHMQVTGTIELQEDLFSVYASDKTIYVKSDQNIDNGTISVCDIVGRVISKQEIINSNSVSIPVNVNTGIYIVVIETELGISSNKVIIK